MLRKTHTERKTILTLTESLTNTGRDNVHTYQYTSKKNSRYMRMIRIYIHTQITRNTEYTNTRERTSTEQVRDTYSWRRQDDLDRHDSCLLYTSDAADE